MEAVECLASAAYPGRPVALTWEGERLEIEAVLSEWRTPEERHFRVRCREARTFELVYMESARGWRIQYTPGG